VIFRGTTQPALTRAYDERELRLGESLEPSPSPESTFLDSITQRNDRLERLDRRIAIELLL
jgi:hypothetical protein